MTATALFCATPPDWVPAVFEELDTKRYGAGLDVLTDDAEFQLGVHRWRGREAVREKLRAANVGIDSMHRIHQFWSDGSVKILRGEITVTASDTGQAVTAAIGHFLEIDEDDRTKVRRWIGAFGPLS